MKKRMITYLQLAWEFFKTGLFSVGGGLATLPFLYSMSAKTGWFTMMDISNMIAISESTPGPMGINMATYVGFTSFGIIGTFLAPLSLVLPSVIVIILVAKILDRFKESRLVANVFSGLRPASTALIASAGISVALMALFHVENFIGLSGLSAVFNYKAILLAVVMYIAIKKFDKHPIVYILAYAVIGILFQF